MFPAIVYIKMMRLLQSFLQICLHFWVYLFTCVQIYCLNFLYQIQLFSYHSFFSIPSFNLVCYDNCCIYLWRDCIQRFCFKRFRRITSLIIAVLVSAVMFGIIHLNINQMCYAIVVGVVFALANFSNGSIWTSITIIFIVNNIGFLFMDKANGKSLAEDAKNFRTDRTTMLSIGIILLIISLGFSFLIKKVLRKFAQNENNQETIEFFGSKKDKELAWYIFQMTEKNLKLFFSI